MYRANGSNATARQVGGAVGLLLIAFGIGFGVWMVRTADALLNHPEEIPLLEAVLADDRGRIDVGGGGRAEGVAVSFSTSILPVVVVGFLLFALGPLAAAVVSGGVKLLRGALGFQPADSSKD